MAFFCAQINIFECKRHTKSMKIDSQIDINIQKIEKNLKNNIDLIRYNGYICGTRYCIFYIQNFVDIERLSDEVIKPINLTKNISFPMLDNLMTKILNASGQQKLETLNDCEKHILEGNAVLFVDGENSAIMCAMNSGEERSVQEPPTSAVIFGPREGFVESIKTNTVLIRKRLPTKSLKIVQMNIGVYTKTKVNIMYLDDIADTKIVKRIKDKISEIKIDGVIDSHYLVNYLEENKDTMFKQVGKAEKPDVVVAKMLEGRVAIVVDGSPIVLTVPFMLLEDLQNSDDYYQGSFRISFIRSIRFFGVLISMILPGLYVAMQLYHYRIVPLKFLVTLMNSIQGLPFPPFMEMLFVIILFEILYEASLRMPKYLGIALGIVGALVLGDTAVKAGLISPPAVMIVALSGISFYTIPDQAAQLSLFRIIFTIIGGSLGLFGVVIASMMLVIYLASFNSYGVPYLAPYAPYIKQDLADGIFKKDVIARDTRPMSIPSKKKKRIKNIGE